MTISTLYTRAHSKYQLRKAAAFVRSVNALESWAKALSAEDLSATFQQLRPTEEHDKVKGFALVREAAFRVLGLRLHDVQLLGSAVLLEGKLAEMRTGEGKTLTLVAPAAMLALFKQGVHVVTANPYLAARDAAQMRGVYDALGLSVGVASPEQSKEERRSAYAQDVTYGVGSEFGFDYLKDNLVYSLADKVQRPPFAAIVDEIDSVLIDEARVPMIISGRDADLSAQVILLNKVVGALTPGQHYVINLKERDAGLTDEGYAKAEALLVQLGAISAEADLYSLPMLPWVRRLHSTVRAYALYRKDRDYVVENNEIVLVDTGTGRKMEGRRLEDGLHEALEAREGLSVKQGTRVQATVTFQNYFARYSRLAGLTGTAITEAEEFAEIYNLATVVIPTNRPSKRKHLPDLLFLSRADKLRQIVSIIAERHALGQPILVGCGTIRDAEIIDAALNNAKLPHNTLTAKYLTREAEIIAQAGLPGAITVATNMAGRGTDIVLGGEPPHALDTGALSDNEAWLKRKELVLSLGGLFVLGTERNGIRRVDNQLAGRSGRQGDPGLVQFVLSLEDDLFKGFGAESRLVKLARSGLSGGAAITGTLLAKLVSAAQQKEENAGFNSRKSLMQYDGVLASQREALFSLRDSLLVDSLTDPIRSALAATVRAWLDQRIPLNTYLENLDLADLKRSLQSEFGLDLPLLKWVSVENLSVTQLHSSILDAADKVALDNRDGYEAPEVRQMMLSTLDEAWSEHLSLLDELRANSSLKGNTGRNPVHQYHQDAFDLFEELVAYFQAQVTKELFCSSVQEIRKVQSDAADQANRAEARLYATLERRWVTRNEPCPCGSGKKFRLCHGKFG
jgi:preprotein translocase subunit SecA